MNLLGLTAMYLNISYFCVKLNVIIKCAALCLKQLLRQCELSTLPYHICFPALLRDVIFQ